MPDKPITPPAPAPTVELPRALLPTATRPPKAAGAGGPPAAPHIPAALQR